MPSELPRGHIAHSMAEVGSSSRLPIAEEQGSSTRMDNKNDSNNGNVAGDGHVDDNGTRGDYHRHSPHQIQELESFFKNFPNPNHQQKMELSRDLGLTPSQVTYWFQNTRTKLKTQGGRTETSMLKVENERLNTENINLKITFGNASCVSCAGPISNLSPNVHRLQLENLKLKEEINEKMAILGSVPKPIAEQLVIRETDEPTLDVQRQSIIKAADSAMQVFLQLALFVEPSWLPVGINGNNYTLDEDKYFSTFRNEPAPRLPGFRWEATRDSATVMINPAVLIGLLMNVSQWSDFFCPIVANAIPLEVVSTGAAGSYDGAIQLMNVEFQMLTPLIPTRKTCMARFCKQYGEGIWAVVDFSLDRIRMQVNPLMKFLKRPSGCLIERLPNGSSKITWIEHVEVEDVGHNMLYSWVINSGVAFGAKHWLSILHWRSRRFVSSIAPYFPPNDACNIGGLLKVAEDMVIGFCRKAGATNSWKTLFPNGSVDEVTLMSYTCSTGLVISVTSSMWLPASPMKVFDYFRDEGNRAQWEILTEGAHIGKIAHITTGDKTGNEVALLSAIPTENSEKFILQASFASQTGCIIVYAPVDFNAMNNFLHGGATYEYPLSPSGFSIIPDCSLGGSLLMMNFKILVDTAPGVQLMLSYAEGANLMSRTVKRVRSVFDLNQMLI